MIRAAEQFSSGGSYVPLSEKVTKIIKDLDKPPDKTPLFLSPDSIDSLLSGTVIEEGILRKLVGSYFSGRRFSIVPLIPNDPSVGKVLFSIGGFKLWEKILLKFYLSRRIISSEKLYYMEEDERYRYKLIHYDAIILS